MTRLPLFDEPTVKVLTVRQPWAHLIVAGLKTIENRTWRTNYRGPLYIHAASKMHDRPVAKIERQFGVTIDPDGLTLGAVIGRVNLIDIVTQSDSLWFEGPFGWVLQDAEAITNAPLRGQMDLFEIPAKTVRQPSLRRL
jgi:ASCH domain